MRGYDVRTGKRLVDLPHHSQPASSAPKRGRDGSLRTPVTLACGRRSAWTRSWASPTCRWSCRPATITAGTGPGNGLFGESIVAVDLKTGKRRWHYQFVHHGIWDWDIPCAPMLVDITWTAGPIKAVAQPTKQAGCTSSTAHRKAGLADRGASGREVRRAGREDQPDAAVLTKPPAFDRQGVSLDDLIDFTPELRAEAVKLVSRYKIGPIFTPPVVSKWEGPLGTLMLPSRRRRQLAGRRRRSRNADPLCLLERHGCTRAVPSMASARTWRTSEGRRRIPALRPGYGWRRAAAAAVAAQAARRPKAAPRLNVQGLPLVKPPYGRITAFDLNKGEIVWQIPHGDTPDNIREPSGAQGADHSANRAPRPDRDARDENTGHRR